MILNILPLDEKGEAVVAFAAPVIARPPLLVIARHEVPKQSHLFTQLHRDPWNASTLTKSESGCRNGNF